MIEEWKTIGGGFYEVSNFGVVTSNQVAPTAQEEWRSIPGSTYEISSFGRARSTAWTRPGWKARILKPSTSGKYKAYLKITLDSDSGRTSAYIHDLVAFVFIGPKLSSKEVNHIDGNSKNNCVVNLEYVSRQQNCEHQKMIGHTSRGETHHFHKLTWDQVREIRRYSREIPAARIAKAYPVTPRTIRRIRSNFIWQERNV